jgi:hypothetical protein
MVTADVSPAYWRHISVLNYSGKAGLRGQG